MNIARARKKDLACHAWSNRFLFPSMGKRTL
jgi:hypothetical protein